VFLRRALVRLLLGLARFARGDRSDP